MRLPVFLLLSLTSFVCMAAAETASVPAVPPPSLQDFAKRAAVQDMKLSPNGKLLAATIPVDNARLRLGVIDLETMQIKSSIQLRTKDETFESFMWVNDTYLLLSIGYRPGGLADAQLSGELATLNVESGRFTYAFGYRGEMQTGTRIEKAGGERMAAIAIAPVPDSQLALVKVQRFGPTDTAGVRTLDVATGKHSRVTQAPVANPNFVVDNTGEVRIAYGGATVDEHRVHVRDAGGKWRLFETRENTGRYLTPRKFAADNTHFYAVVTREDAPDALLKVNIADGTETQVYASAIVDPGELISNFEDTDVVAVLNNEDKPRLHWLQAASEEARLVRAMEKQMPDHLVRPVSSSKDGNRVLLLASSDRNAGDYFLFDRTSKKADFVMARRNWLPINALAPMQPITLKARDGLELRGYLTLPNPPQEGADSKPPLVVLVHGGPHTERDFWEYNSDVQALATRGFAVLQVNFRGSGGYGVEFQYAGYRQWGRKMQDDVTDATRWAIESGQVDAERVAIYGASYGGYAALMGAAREPDLYRCAISYIGVTDLPMMFTRGDIEDTEFGMSYLRTVLGSDQAELEANSPSRLADRIKAKVMLVHGARDERVPIKHAEVMRAALRKAGNEPEWYVEGDEAHGFVKESANEQLYTRVDGFLRSCLK